MEKGFHQNQEPKKSIFRYPFLSYVAPVILFFLTICTTIVGGFFLVGNKFEFSMSLLKGIPYAVAIIIIIGAHALGHYIAARICKVKAFFPYFIPSIDITGTIGAFTKMEWPILNRKALIKIFMAGPIAGFCVTWIILIIGLYFSEVVDRTTMPNNTMVLGDSLVMYVTQLAVFGRLPETKDIVLHPVAFAGWLGINYNFWHLLPIGKLDGGRLIYALWGYNVTRWVSIITIIVLLIFGFIFSNGWFGMAIFGIFCIIKFREQYPSERYDEPLEKSIWIFLAITVIIFIVSFMPKSFSMVAN